MHDRVKATRAARNRRYRERKQNRTICAHVEISEAALDFLQRWNWLREADARDVVKIAAAVKNMLELSAKV
jgi:hypothetical protein